MIILFFRLLSWITGILGLFVSLWQLDSAHALTYPWPLVFFLGWFLLVAIVLAWRRLTLRDAIEKIFPSVLILATIGLGFLMAETAFERWILVVLYTVIPFLILELLFLFIYAPSRYPVSGLSRSNITLIPLGAFYLGSSLNQLSVFIRLHPWVFFLACILFSGLTFLLTGHPTASPSHRRRWGILGGIIGLQVAFIGLLLPISIAAHGALTALFVAFPLRLRRYAYQPTPSRRLAWGEGILVFCILIILLVSSRWV